MLSIKFVTATCTRMLINYNRTRTMWILGNYCGSIRISKNLKSQWAVNYSTEISTINNFDTLNYEVSTGPISRCYQALVIKNYNDTCCVEEDKKFLLKLQQAETFEDVLSEASDSLKRNTFSFCIASQATVRLYELQTLSKMEGKFLENIDRQQSLLKNSIVWSSILERISKESNNIPLDVVAELIYLLQQLHTIEPKGVVVCVENLLYNGCYPNFAHLDLVNLNNLSQYFFYPGHQLKNSVLLAPLLGKLKYIVTNTSRKIKEGDTDTLKKITKSIFHLRTAISDNLLFKFSELLRSYLKDNKSDDKKLLMRCLAIFSVRSNSDEYVEIFNDTQQVIVDNLISFIPIMDYVTLSISTKSLLTYKCNLDKIWKAIGIQALALLNERNITTPSSNKQLSIEKLNLILCIASSGISCDKEAIENEFGSILNNSSSISKLPVNTLTICDIVNKLPVTNFKVLDIFFGMLCSCETTRRHNIAIIKLYIDLRIKMRDYHHLEFERLFSELLITNLQKMDGHMPKLISNYGSFLIAFNLKKTPFNILNLVNNNFHQYDYHEVHLLSKSFKVSLEQINNSFQQKLKDQILLFSRQSLNLLTAAVPVHQIWQQMYIYLTLKSKKELSITSDFHVDSLQDQLNKHAYAGTLIGQTARSLSSLSLFLPRIADEFSDLILQSKTNQSVKNISPFLWYLFIGNYGPKHFDDVFRICTNILKKYMQELTVLDQLKSCLALSFFEKLDLNLAKSIFCTDFIDMMEMEFSRRRTSNDYSAKVMHYMMELNRVICLDYPEFKLPWLHERFCQSQVLSKTLKLPPLKREVYIALQDMLDGSQFCRVFNYTPYYYLIDFECFVDKNKHCLVSSDYGDVSFGSSSKSDKHYAKISDQLPNDFHRLAVCVLPVEAFTLNLQQMKGFEVRKKRHLEMLGYQVVQVPFYEWNSLQLSHPKNKRDYLRNKIFGYC